MSIIISLLCFVAGIAIGFVCRWIYAKSKLTSAEQAAERISEEAALVRLRLQISNLEKQLKDAERKAEEATPDDTSAVTAEETPSEIKLADEEPIPPEEPKKKKPEEMIEEFPDDIFTGEVEEVEFSDDDEI